MFLGVAPMIPRRRLPRGGLSVSELSFGGSQLGNLYRAISDAEAAATVDAAREEGITYFDTAPHYGLGLSEQRLGAALAALPRDAFVISSKVGRILVPDGGDGTDPEGFAVPATHRRVWDFSPEGIRRSLDQSLQRLRLDRLDIVYLHDPDAHLPQVLESGYPALDELRAEGAVTAIGAGMNDAALLSELVRQTDLDVVMLAGRYTLLEQGGLDDLLPLCQERGVGVVTAGIFNSGLLASPRPHELARYNYEAAPRALVERARAMARICERHGTTLPAAAIAFPLAHSAVVSVCVGARSAEQVRRNAELFGRPISPGLWSELKEEGLLRADAPVPSVATCPVG
jgi:D-threo-aldose 1-dehydrogenase